MSVFTEQLATKPGSQKVHAHHQIPGLSLVIRPLVSDFMFCLRLRRRFLAACWFGLKDASKLVSVFTEQLATKPGSQKVHAHHQIPGLSLVIRPLVSDFMFCLRLRRRFLTKRSSIRALGWRSWLWHIWPVSSCVPRTLEEKVAAVHLFVKQRETNACTATWQVRRTARVHAFSFLARAQ